MTHMREDDIRKAFHTQAGFCRGLGSDFTAHILEACVVVLDRSTETGRAILDWPGDPLADAMTLRLTGGLHALARTGDFPDLSELYKNQQGDAEAILREALERFDAYLLPWLSSPPQTNEVGRSGALMAGLMVAADRIGMPITLLELGASAGLNLNLDRFAYQLGGLHTGTTGSAVRIEPKWTGNAPPDRTPEIAERAAADQSPLDPSDPEVAERLIAYVWPDQAERLARIEAAIALAREFPPNVERGDAADWIETQLAQPQREGTARIIVHSVFWQYVPRESQNRIAAAIHSAAASATMTAPLGWLRFEPKSLVAEMHLELQIWPGGETIDLARCHAHGSWINWLI